MEKKKIGLVIAVEIEAFEAKYGAPDAIINIHGQHDSQQLFDEQTHLVYLDLFADNNDSFKNYQDDAMDLRAFRFFEKPLDF